MIKYELILICIFAVVFLEKLRRRTGGEGEMAKKERRIDANEYVCLKWLYYVLLLLLLCS